MSPISQPQQRRANPALQGGFVCAPVLPPAAALQGQNEPYRVSFTPSGIEVVAKLTTADSADELIQVITNLKALIKKPISAIGIEGKKDEAAN